MPTAPDLAEPSGCLARSFDPLRSPTQTKIRWIESLTAWFGRLTFCSLKLCENWGVESFTTVIHEDPEGGFWAEVPALPGCYSQGETMDELMENVREAINGVLEVMKEQGKQPESNIQILDVVV